MFNIIKTFLTPYTLYIKIALGVTVVAALGFLYFSWKWSIEEAAILKFKTQQQEQIIQDQNNRIDFLKTQIEVTNKLVQEKQKSIEELEKELDNAEKIVQDENKEDQPSSKILRDTIEQLQKLRK